MLYFIASVVCIISFVASSVILDAIFHRLFEVWDQYQR
jgi:hypothetical protein